MKWHSSAVLITLIAASVAKNPRGNDSAEHSAKRGKKLTSFGKAQKKTNMMAKKAMAPGVAQLSSPGLEKDGYQLCMKLEGVGKYEGPYDWIIGQKWTCFSP
mmetsp:Transcript_54675/g.124495  ORF Transcript_54675/g.124495 Transcript_54675/m.124495 type:complete len:102 (+) Transcript_54675:296-601(+)